MTATATKLEHANGALAAIVGWEDFTAAEWDESFTVWAERYKRLVAHHGDELTATRELFIEIAREALAVSQ